MEAREVGINEAALKGAHILMVDDEVSSTCLMTNFLNRVGYRQLRSINDSRQAFEAIETFAPDLILLDLNMPELDGFEIMSAMRAHRRNEQIPVLVLTGDPSAANKRRALAVGATDLLVKPFDASEVSMRIRNLLHAHFLRLEIRAHNRLLEARVRERTAELERALSDLQAVQRRALQQERLSAFGEMAGGVVHDFSNALMSIIGYSEMLLSNAGARADEATALEYLRIINTAGRDGAHVVSRLRDFYRPREAADLFELLDLNEIATQAIALTKPRSAKREPNQAVCFQTDFSSNVTASGIGAELREVLTNLIFNALDAISGAGRVLITTRLENNEAIVEITDTGTGMTPEVKERCLEPFFTTKGAQGTGLGLAMVFGIIKRHQGILEIDSELNRGTTVRLRLPLAPASALPFPVDPP
ncbi:MAG TPA: response regulator [Chthoniobacterales bacterium]|jgi:signal transduction histidine kinase|nr:response regulator [Chthoniobacterales bacterium]